MRLLIAVPCIFLGACSLPIESLAPTATQANEPEESETCASLSELAIGMTTSQVLSSCKRRPLRTSDIITRDGKMDTIWAYRGSYLHFTGGKLERIQPVQQ
jgi:hypothetical protein